MDSVTFFLLCLRAARKWRCFLDKGKGKVLFFVATGMSRYTFLSRIHAINNITQYSSVLRQRLEKTHIFRLSAPRPNLYPIPGYRIWEKGPETLI